MATYSRGFAWEIPWTEELGGLQSMGSKKSCTQFSDFGHNLVTKQQQQFSEYKIKWQKNTYWNICVFV